MIVKVVELRLRFIALMAATGLVFGYWDTLVAYHEKYTRPARSGSHLASEGFEFFCPMHPTVVQPKRGGCPICGMPLSRRKIGAVETLPAGVSARVALSPGRVAQAGIRTHSIGYAPLRETIRTVGTVAFDERRLARISSRIKGLARVERLHVDFTGTKVQAGDPLVELYSPELTQAFRELLLAKGPGEDATSPAGRALLGEGSDLVALARQKLALWGITPAQIDEVLARGKADDRITLRAPIGGVVLRKNVVEGQYVAEGDAMFEVADLSRLWVLARIHEDQIGLVREGQEAEARVEAFPGERFKGKVAFLDPALNPESRTLGARFDLENTDGRLRPGMFAAVTVSTPLADFPAFRNRLAQAPRTSAGELSAEQQRICPVTSLKLGAMGTPIAVLLADRKVWTCCGSCEPKLRATPAKYLARLDPPPADTVLAVPESAVVDTGLRKLVYVETAPGVFEGREVVLGPLTGDAYPVLEGLEPGENVATAGAFLIDAESRLNPGRAPASTPAPPREHEHPPIDRNDPDLRARSAASESSRLTR